MDNFYQAEAELTNEKVGQSMPNYKIKLSKTN